MEETISMFKNVPNESVERFTLIFYNCFQLIHKLSMWWLLWIQKDAFSKGLRILSSIK